MKEEKTKQTQTEKKTDNAKPQKGFHWRNNIGNLLLVTGIVIIAIPFIGRYLADREQERMLKEFYQQLEADLGDESDKLNQSLGYTDDATLQKDLDASAKAIAEINLNEGLNTDTVTKLKTGPTAIAIIDIPKIGLKYPVAEGVDNTTLRFCIGHMPGTAGLGETGNSVLAGHRSHSFGDFFNRLDELNTNDVILIKTANATTTYTVFEKKRVHKTDLSVLAANKTEKELTLITCELGINPEDRIIVKARVEGYTAPEPATEQANEPKEAEPVQTEQKKE